MKKCLLLILILAATNLIAQDVKKQKENTRNGTAKYYVLKSDMLTKHGEYTIKAYSGSTILVSGNYSYGKREGLWVERYYLQSRNLKCKGKYREDKKIDKWSYYNFRGELVQVYDHSKKLLLESKECGKNNETEYYKGEELVKGKLDCPPSIIGGKELYINELTEEIMSFRFPINERGRTHVELNNKISLFVLENGEIENIQFYEPVENKELRAFIESKIMERNGDWIPGSKNSENVKAKLVIPLQFRMTY